MPLPPGLLGYASNASTSDMILTVDTDAPYLSEVGGKSIVTAYYWMTKDSKRESTNGAVEVLSVIVKQVISSTLVAETEAL